MQWPLKENKNRIRSSHNEQHTLNIIYNLIKFERVKLVIFHQTAVILDFLGIEYDFLERDERITVLQDFMGILRESLQQWVGNDLPTEMVNFPKESKGRIVATKLSNLVKTSEGKLKFPFRTQAVRKGMCPTFNVV